MLNKFDKIILSVFMVFIAVMLAAATWTSYPDQSTIADADTFLFMDSDDATAAKINEITWAQLLTELFAEGVANSAGDVYTGAHDFGGATSIEIVNGTDPDVDATGEVSHDTDGANESNDESFRGYDGTNQFLIDRKIKCFQATVIAPNDLDDTERDCTPIWHNNTGMVFTLLEIWGWSDTDDTSVNVEVVTATNWTTRNTVDALEIAADGTGVYSDTETSFTDSTIAHDEIITLDFDDTDTPGVVKVNICGWFNADID